jgi:protein involved in polysaccharide export with SLBB domain
MGGDKITFPSRPMTVLVTGEVNRPGLLSFIDGDDVGSYVDRAGGLTDSASYAILAKPTGESRRVNFGFFSADPKVPEGSSIIVFRKAPEPVEEKRIDWSTTIKDSFAIVASAATIIYLISQVTK